MKLSDTIAIWEILHVKNTGDVCFRDLAEAIKQIVGEENDMPPLNEEYLIGKLTSLISETRIPAECPEVMLPFTVLKYTRDILEEGWRKINKKS